MRHALKRKVDENGYQRRWALDLVRVRRCKVGRSSPPPKQKVTTAPELTKIEVLNLRGTLAAQARLQGVLARLRARSRTPEDLHQAERVKEKLDFLGAVLAAGVRDEASNTLRNTVTYRKLTPSDATSPGGRRSPNARPPCAASSAPSTRTST